MGDQSIVVVIGVVGGVASGKSFVTVELEKSGARRIDADRLGHRALEDEQVRNFLRDRFGDAIFAPTGEVDRRALAAQVFGEEPQQRDNLAFLEGVTHPRIKAWMEAQLNSLRREGVPAAVLDAALLLKAGWDRYCDYVLFVEAPESARIERALARGWSVEQWEAREAAQISLAEKRRRSDVVIDNSGTPETTAAQVGRFWATHVEPLADRGGAESSD